MKKTTSKKKKLRLSLIIAVTAVVLLVTALVVILTQCTGGYYKPVESTEREATPVFRLGEHTVNFEVLRAFFYSECLNSPDYSDTYFTGAEGEARFAAVKEAAIRDIAEIYALLTLCEGKGIDTESEEILTAVDENVKTSVDGGTFGEYEIRGFDSYREYLAYLEREFHMNDAVNRLMMRYAVCEDALNDYYELGHPYTEADVRAFFESEDCVRLLWVSRFDTSGGLDRAENLRLMSLARGKLLSADPHKALQYSLEPTTDFYLGRYTLDKAYYAPLIRAVYALPDGGVTEVIDLGSEGLFVARRMEKSAQDLSSRYEELTRVYLGDVMYGEVERIANEFLQGIVYEDFYHSLTAEDILSES